MAKATRHLSTLITVLLAAAGGWFVLRFSGILIPERRMFHNIVARGDWDLLPGWKVGPPTGDRTGNRVWLDEQLNILVVVFLARRVSDGEPVSTISQKFDVHSATFMAGETRVLVEPADHDSVLLISEEGAVLRIPRCLGAGDARKVFRALDTCSLNSALADCLQTCDLLPEVVRGQVGAWLVGIRREAGSGA